MPRPKLLSNIQLTAAMACIAVATPAGASVLDAGPTDRVALDVPKDAVITTVAVLGALLPSVFTSQLAPANCRWCDGSVGSPVNSVDNWFHEHFTVSSRSKADKASSFLAYGLMPVLALGGAVFATGPHATEGAGFRAAAIVIESVAVAGAFTQALKFSLARQRPYAHFASGPPDPSVSMAEANLSFPSGHSSITAAAGTSAAMVATLEESSAAPWLWVAASVTTVSVGTLRMMSESHYFTDVVGGAALGTACGIVVPLLHRRGSWLGGDAIPSLAAGDGGASFSLSGRF